LPYIIGKKGVNLKTIQELSGANVKVPKREDTETTSVAASDDVEEDMVDITIEGVDEAVRIAKDEINKIIDERVSLFPTH
jgi:transcription antitermination factor NusA-like protein